MTIMEDDLKEKAPAGVTPPEGGRRFGCGYVLLFVLAAAVLSAGLTFLAARAWLFPSPFEPVQLSEQEERTLETKLERLNSGPRREPAPLEPEPYSESGASREISLTEKELNALLAKNTDLAQRLAIDLSKDLVSAKLIVPVDEDFPVLGGKMIRVRAGAEFAFNEGRPVIILRGVSVMGVPLPNAWLGGLKNIDLVGEFSGEEGFWKAFADGVDFIGVEEGKLKIRLRE
jgi:hypothetical protein